MSLSNKYEACQSWSWERGLQRVRPASVPVRGFVSWAPFFYMHTHAHTINKKITRHFILLCCFSFTPPPPFNRTITFYPHKCISVSVFYTQLPSLIKHHREQQQYIQCVPHFSSSANWHTVPHPILIVDSLDVRLTLDDRNLYSQVLDIQTGEISWIPPAVIC